MYIVAVLLLFDSKVLSLFFLVVFLLCHCDAALVFTCSCFVVIYCCCSVVVVVDAAFWCFFQCYFFESPTYCCCQVIFNVFRAFVLITVLLLSPSFTLRFRFTPLIAAYMRLFLDAEWKKQFANPYCWDISCISPQFHNTCTPNDNSFNCVGGNNFIFWNLAMSIGVEVGCKKNTIE